MNVYGGQRSEVPDIAYGDFQNNGKSVYYEYSPFFIGVKGCSLGVLGEPPLFDICASRAIGHSL